MPEPITELPMLEGTLWESAWAAECEGDHAEALDLVELLSTFGYEVLFGATAMTLRPVGTGQEMTWPTPPRWG